MPESQNTAALPIGVAPMEGVTVFPMRAWFALASGPASQGTPFLRVTPTFPHKLLPRAFAPELGELKDVTPYALVPQMMAADADDFVRAADYFPADVPFVELNCGCPSPTCVGKGAGSSLLKDAALFHSTIESLARRLGPGRLAVKMRLGFAAAEEFPDLLAGIKAMPLARLTVHGRTRPMGYKGHASWSAIARAAETMDAPVFASGDVVCRASFAERTGRAPVARGVIIGRGALRNPWIFAELRTGGPTAIETGALLYALACHAILHELFASKLEVLYASVKDGLLLESCGTDRERWRHAYERLATMLYGTVPSLEEGELAGRLPLSRPIIGRCKMLWNYLRSSLPPDYFEPTLLRSKDLGELLDGILRLGPRDRVLPLAHQGKWDWLYSGERRETAPTAATCH